MTLKNKFTGSVLELPPPNEMGESFIKLNGIVIERLLFSDNDGGSVTLGNGREFRGGSPEFNHYVIGLLAQQSPKEPK